MKATAIIVMGVSGCGKSSMAQALTQRLKQENLSATMLEGDEFHPQANVEKMRSGQALNDQDREPWLLRLNEQLRSTLAKGEFAVLACSALKQKYRDLLGQGIENLTWIHLSGSFDLIEARMKARQHKYMPTSLLRSQFETLEAPQQAISLSILEPIETLLDQALKQLHITDLNQTNEKAKGQ